MMPIDPRRSVAPENQCVLFRRLAAQTRRAANPATKPATVYEIASPHSMLLRLRTTMVPITTTGRKGLRRLAGRPMSALGQKRTHAVQQVMSALPPKADIDWLI